ncbi:GNAT family N-acetyltransferase [Aquimonas sp.]|jgi:acetyltransferase|uniref:bifunctional acetate--CoA ligase family protein/GNAT family N-acetyltransferase n=1 Tax=Aquimonas sp. TaxID=1872588 RepID=UPI0037BE5857
MSREALDALFKPASIAVIGASTKSQSLGRVIARNLRTGGFSGPLDVVSPKYPRIDGIRTARSIAELDPVPELVVVTVPPALVPRVLDEAGSAGVKAAVVITAGLGQGEGSLREQASKIARQHGLRLVGPNCLGILSPLAGINASFAAAPALPGDLALLAQSGAVVTTVVEWANQRGIGFSGIVSLGDMADVDVGELLDYFATDSATRAILIYMESVRDVRRFMSAARAAARAKPVIVVKAGRHAAGARAAASHTGALAGSDAVFDAALRRAGVLRVYDMEELFAAANTLSSLKPTAGKRLAILTNGGGVGILAVDRLVDLDGEAAELSAQTRERLDAVLPDTWSHSNPVDIVGDAGVQRYTDALDVLLEAPEVDAVFVVHVPTALAAPVEVAEGLARHVRARREREGNYAAGKPILACWLAQEQAARNHLQAAGIPTYRTLTGAVRGFVHLTQYTEAQQQLLATPPSLPADFSPDAERARRALQMAEGSGRRWLPAAAVHDLLAAYGIPSLPMVIVPDADAAAAAAQPWIDAGQRAVLKIVSADIAHKSDVGGVALNLDTVEAVRRAAIGMFDRVREALPEARIEGLLVQPMVERAHARELIAGIADDPLFGPVILFGAGGVAVEIEKDTALALPPLHLNLADELIGRTRVERRLAAYRNLPAADRGAVALTLVKLSQLASDLPEVRELDINPLLVDEHGVIALDARVLVEEFDPASCPRVPFGNPRFAIAAYPKEMEGDLPTANGRHFNVRPVRPDDEARLRRFFAAVTADDLRQRYFSPMKSVSPAFIARLTQIDYARVIVLLAVDVGDEVVGIAQVHADPELEEGEYAILLRSDLKGQGLGWALMQRLIEVSKRIGLKQMTGQVLRDNTSMLAMCRQLGFAIRPDPEDAGIALVELPVN